MLVPILFVLALTAAGQPTHSFGKRSTYPNGIATFNNFAAQGNTVCGPKSGQPGTYGAAAGDISPGISGGACPGSIDPSNCAGQSPILSAQPECPRGNCGKCYRVTNKGGVGSSIGGVGNSIIVQIIDSCPAVSPMNYCKTDMPLNQRCGDANTNQLDIDQSAYMALTGQAFGSGPTLNIGIEDSDCSGGPVAPSATPSTPAQLLDAEENAAASGNTPLNVPHDQSGTNGANTNAADTNGISANEKAALHVVGNQVAASSSSMQTSAAQISTFQSLSSLPPSPMNQTSSTIVPLIVTSTVSVLTSSTSPSATSTTSAVSQSNTQDDCDATE